MRKIIMLALFTALVVPTKSNAGELADWIKAAAAVLLHHEAGHYSTGREANAGFALTGENGLSYELDLRAAPAYPDPSGYDGYRAAREADGKMHIYLPMDQYLKWQNDYSVWQRDSDKWEAYARKKEAGVAGGGFVGQQRAIEEAGLPIPIYRKALVLSGVFQAGYILYHYAHAANVGDITRMKMAAPEPLVVSSLALSALSDYYRGTQEEPSKLRLGFMSDPRSGAVGVSFSGVF